MTWLVETEWTLFLTVPPNKVTITTRHWFRWTARWAAACVGMAGANLWMLPGRSTIRREGG